MPSRHAVAGVTMWAAAAVLSACSLQEASNRVDTTSATTHTTASGWNPDSWRPPVVDSTPDDPYAASVYRGLAIITHVQDSLPAYTGSNLNCTSCHLDEGRRAYAAPLAGSFARFPRFIDRVNAVVPIEDRVNYCFTRSLGGTKLPPDSREIQDIVAYLSFISRGVPTGEHVRGEGLAVMPSAALRGDSARGRASYRDNCARCHGNNGGGMGLIPSLWGPRSFSIGASMARRERAASFIRLNMPFDRPGSLTDEQSFDVAAYITSMPRPDLPGKEADYPAGDAPVDVPYDTKGHKAFHPPRVFPRRIDPGGAIVPAPISVMRTR